MCYFSFFFFFKQKTAYEMRISDWSSDVCSSDLHPVEDRIAFAIVDVAAVGARDDPRAPQIAHEALILLRRQMVRHVQAAQFSNVVILQDHLAVLSLRRSARHATRARAGGNRSRNSDRRRCSIRDATARPAREIGSASCRERVCQYV